MRKRRIIIRTQFGEVKVTKDQYAQRWDEHFKGLMWLTSSPEILKELERMRQRINQLASEKFEDLYQKQSLPHEL